MRANDLVLATATVKIHRDAVASLGNGCALGIRAHFDSFILQDFLDRGKNVIVVSRDQPIASLNHGDAAAEAPVHLSKLQTDVTTANNDQVFGQEIDFHHAGVGQVIDVPQTRHVRYASASAEVNEYLVGLQEIIVDTYGSRTLETGFAQTRCSLSVGLASVDLVFETSLREQTALAFFTHGTTRFRG